MSKRREQALAALACVLIAGSLGAGTALAIDEKLKMRDASKTTTTFQLDQTTPTCETCEIPPEFSTWPSHEKLPQADSVQLGIPTPKTH